MLSSPKSGLHARQKQHRRQNSTPSALESAKIPNMPTAVSRKPIGHLRGLSLDTRQHRRHQQQQLQQQQQQQEQQQQQQQQQQLTTSATARHGLEVSIATNNSTGSAATHNPQHHVLREAQQQRAQARPGPHHHHPLHFAPMNPHDRENYLISPHETPHAQRFISSSPYDAAAIPFSPHSADINLMMQKNHESYDGNMTGNRDFGLFPPADASLTTQTFMGFPDHSSATSWSSEPPVGGTMRRISSGILGRVAKFENMAADGHPRPVTPSSQNENGQCPRPMSWCGPSALNHSPTVLCAAYLPLTPLDTPSNRLLGQESQPERFSDDFDESMQETIRPIRGRSKPRAQSLFEQEPQLQDEAVAMASSPSQSINMSEGNSFNGMHMQAPPPSQPDYMSMANFRNEFARVQDEYDSIPQFHPVGTMVPGLDPAQPPPSETQPMGQFVCGYGNESGLDSFGVAPGPAPAVDAGSETKQSARRTPPHRRTESVASAASAASIASINIEETKTETGVSQEDIAVHIRSPETTDGKWICLYDECGKEFGRKENIKSHVQTHLNDRQYECPTCHKRFVRHHDLKRHAKIHTGIKPYPCECGNSFARHDALTRHRQRGMCIGAFDGIVRKVAKRGRPRKNRPDLDTRLDKSRRQRKKNMSISSMSSVSVCSDSSAVNSPDHSLGMLNDAMNMNFSFPEPKAASFSSAPMPMSAGPVRAAGHSVPSPSPASSHSFSIAEAVPIRGRRFKPSTSPSKSVASHCMTPPELSQSCSPPQGGMFDLDPNMTVSTDESSALSAAAGIAEPTSMCSSMPVGIGQQDEDLLLPFPQEDSLVQMDGESNMLVLSKFDEEYESVGMFSSNDDVFFGGT